jgi:hypothetical protein
MRARLLMTYFDLKAREQGEEVETAPSLRHQLRSRPSPQPG